MPFSDAIVLEIPCLKCKKVLLESSARLELHRLVTCSACGTEMLFSSNQWREIEWELDDIENGTVRKFPKLVAKKATRKNVEKLQRAIA